jgi:hypothetical protein
MVTPVFPYHRKAAVTGQAPSLGLPVQAPQPRDFVVLVRIHAREGALRILTWKPSQEKVRPAIPLMTLMERSGGRGCCRRAARRGTGPGPGRSGVDRSRRDRGMGDFTNHNAVSFPSTDP